MNIEKALIFLDQNFDTTDQLFDGMFGYLYENGYVKESYLKALKEREKNFPTGLPIIGNAVAIPHCEPEYIHKPFISFVRLQQPVTFIEMGSDDTELHVRLIFFLGFENKNNTQVELLQHLMNSFLTGGLAEKIDRSKTIDECYEILVASLGKEDEL